MSNFQADHELSHVDKTDFRIHKIYHDTLSSRTEETLRNATNKALHNADIEGITEAINGYRASQRLTGIANVEWEYPDTPRNRGKRMTNDRNRILEKEFREEFGDPPLSEKK